MNNSSLMVVFIILKCAHFHKYKYKLWVKSSGFLRLYTLVVSGWLPLLSVASPKIASPTVWVQQIKTDFIYWNRCTVRRYIIFSSSEVIFETFFLPFEHFTIWHLELNSEKLSHHALFAPNLKDGVVDETVYEFSNQLLKISLHGN